jgi:hypothetical protein
MKKLILHFFLFFSTCIFAQVGINTTTPNAQLDIRSSNQVAPTSTDGMLIPKVDTFPATNPSIDQQGMLVYLTSDVGSNQPGFYYWDNVTTSWIPIKGTDSGTLDQAYDFGGAGNGNIITADAGAVFIDGTDGLVSTGSLNSGALAPTGAGTRMVWNPRKAAFRAGNVTFDQWDDINIGQNSTAFGINTIASGNNSFASGTNARASGFNSTAFGSFANSSGSNSFSSGLSVIASGQYSAAFGESITASGVASFTLGRFSGSSGNYSFALGFFNNARSFGEVVVGVGATAYIPSTNGETQFRTANAGDRLFVIGNAIDSNNNNTVDASERSDAMVVLKNGATGIGSSAPEALLDVDSNDKGVLVPRVALTSANVASPIINPSGGALPVSTLVYNTTTAGVGENEVTPGFHYWNGSRWIKFDTNETGKSKYYTALGNTNAAINITKTLMPQMQITFTPKSDVVMIQFSASGSSLLGQRAIYFDLMLNGSLVKGFQSTTEDINETGRPIWDINILYPVQVTQGISQTISINWGYIGPSTLTSHVLISHPVSSGHFINAHRVLTVIDPNGGASIETTTPIPVINSFWSPNGNSGLNSTANFIGTNDNVDLNFRRNGAAAGGIKPFNTHLGVGSLFDLTTGTNNAAFGNNALNNNSIGNSNVGLGNSALVTNTIGNFNTGIGSFSNVSTSNLENATAIGARSFVAASNSLILGSISGINGATSSVNVGIGTTIPQERLHVGGRTLLTNGFSADNAALLYQNDTDYMFLGPQSGSSTNGAAVAFYGSTNNNGSNLGGINFSVPIGEVRINHNGGSHVFRANSTSGYTSTFELNDNGLQIGHNSASRSILFNPNNTEQMRLTPVGNLGIGTPAPTRKLHLSENTTSTTNGQFYIEQQGTGDALMHIGNTGGRHFNIGVDTSTDSFKIGTSATTATAVTTGTVMTLQATGEVGIGTITPSEKLHVSGPAGLTAIRIGNTSTIGTTSNVALDFLRGGNANTDWRIFNIGANLTLGNSADDLATINNLYQFQGSRFMPMTDATISLGQTANRWNTLFASNGTINTSDAREKKNIQNIKYGLNTLMQLRPVSFEWKKEDGSGTKLGLIAQELQQVVPEVVRDWDWEEDEQGNRKKVASPILSVYYSDLIPVLIKATQEQQVVIEQQKEEINLLKQQLQEQYKSIIERLEKIENK